MITNMNTYNLKKQSFKRKIPIKKVFGITIGMIGTEFTIHVPDEYDYRYSSPDRRDYAILSILKALKGAPLLIFFKEEVNLTNWTTTKVILIARF